MTCDVMVRSGSYMEKASFAAVSNVVTLRNAFVEDSTKKLRRNLVPATITTVTVWGRRWLVFASTKENSFRFILNMSGISGARHLVHGNILKVVETESLAILVQKIWTENGPLWYASITENDRGSLRYQRDSESDSQDITGTQIKHYHAI